MKAAILETGRIHVGVFPDPTPEQGQVVVRTHRCALCASDAHFLTSGHTIVERSQKNNGPYARIDLGKSIVMGHEYVGEIVDYGPTAQNKYLKINFAGGEMPDDMIAARDAIVEGTVDLRPRLGEGIGLSEIEESLKRMSDPSEPIRRVADPSRL